jgi:AbiU2
VNPLAGLGSNLNALMREAGLYRCNDSRGKLIMGADVSAEEARAESVANMGESLGNIRYELYHQVALLHIRWKEYRALFATSPEIIDLLNGTAPAFFHDIERRMWEDTILHVCRVTDKLKPGGKEALTIRRLPNLVSDPKTNKQLNDLVAIAISKTDFARDWRNRRLAHTDLVHALNPSVQPLATSSRQHVEEALAAIRNVLNCVDFHYFESTVGYEYSIEPLGGAASLLAVLRLGRDAQEEHFRSELTSGISDGPRNA